MNVRNLERVSEEKFKSFEEADKFRREGLSATAKAVSPPAKVKIFARYDGTFDVVWYRKINDPVQKAVEVVDQKVISEKIHGLKSKDRKKDPRKK